MRHCSAEMIMPIPGIRCSKIKSHKIAFQFASGRTQTHVVVTGASGDQMVSFFVFGRCGWALWTSSAELSALVCKVDGDDSGHSDIYLALPPNPLAGSNHSNESEGPRCQGRRKLWSRISANRLVFSPQPSLVRRPGRNRSPALLGNISGSCSYNRCPLLLA